MEETLPEIALDHLVVGNVQHIEEMFAPVEVQLNSKKDCAVAVYHMWRYAIKHLTIGQVFDMVNKWAYEQPEKEEVMKEIMTTLVKKYCPHYTISIVEHDSAYQEKLKEHRELAQLAQYIQETNEGQTMSDESWGNEGFAKFMRERRK
jgi:hypothetical protein